jgi:hypothetical protein
VAAPGSLLSALTLPCKGTTHFFYLRRYASYFLHINILTGIRRKVK